MKERNISIDVNKGLAILLVYLGHSLLYYPISLSSMYGWCAVLDKCITSFNMPLFFMISGFLFWGTKRDSLEIISNKFKRLMIPYLCVMGIILVCKVFLPASLSYHKMDDWGGVSY